MQDIQIGRVYRHFKGDYYLVEGVAQHSETGEPYVIYRKQNERFALQEIQSVNHK